MEPVITVCTGHRCDALLEHTASDTMPALRSAVRGSSQAVLMTTGCVGACAQAPVMAVSRSCHGHGRLQLTGTSWLGPVGRGEVEALCGWVTQDEHEVLPPRIAAVVFRQAQP